MTLVPVDPTSEISVTTLLERAATWLAEAVHRGEPGEIAAVKAQMATAAEATKQLNLSNDIQLDAQEMVRRAEYALGRAIRRGQADGTVAPANDITTIKRMQTIVGHVDDGRPRPTDFASKGELYGSRPGEGILSIADATPSVEAFETAIKEAKAEGNLSRANVGRKARAGSVAVTRDMRAEMIRNLAEQGYSSRQMPSKVGVAEGSIRRIARDFDIEIPADRSISGTRRVDSNRVVANTVTALEGLVMGIELVNFDDLDLREASQWADSLNHSLRALTKFTKQIKETTHD